jgi:hypothetical protein
MALRKLDMIKICENCKIKFETYFKKVKYCSSECYIKKRKSDKKWLEHLLRIGFQKGHDSGRKGKKYPSFSGENHPNWKGDGVGYKSLHQWVASHFPAPDLCQECKKKPPYDLANKGIYNREFKNWEWLCRGCHMKKDGRTEKLIISGDPTGRKHSIETKNKMSLSRKKYWLNKKCLLRHKANGYFAENNFSLVQIPVEDMPKEKESIVLTPIGKVKAGNVKVDNG